MIEKAHEEEIVSLLLNKDERAIRLIYDQYSPALYGVVLKIVGSEQITDDVMQEAFTKVWRNSTLYDSSKGKLFTWLLNIFRNLAIDKTRSKQYRSQQIQIEEKIVSTKVGSHSTNINTIGLTEVVQKLPPELKTLIDLAFYKGYTHKEIAAELNLPLGTVKSRIRRALVHLRELM